MPELSQRRFQNIMLRLLGIFLTLAIGVTTPQQVFAGEKSRKLVEELNKAIDETDFKE